MREKLILKNLILRYPVLQHQEKNIWNAYQMLAECFGNGGWLLTAGNGGSAADAEHIVGELMKGFRNARHIDEDMAARLEAIQPGAGKTVGEKLQRALPAISVACHAALSTAYANDEEPVLVFAQQVYGYGKKGDVLLAISTSGNSENVLYACITAKAKGMKVIGLTGQDGGRLKRLTDVLIAAPGTENYLIQEMHQPIYHCLCLMLEEHLFGHKNNE